jgi:hypothetical protein
MSLNFSTIEAQSNSVLQQKAQGVQNESLQAELVKQHKQDLFSLFEKLFENQQTKTSNGGNTISTQFNDHEVALVALELKPSFQATQTGLKVLISKRLKNDFLFRDDLLDITDYTTLQADTQQYVYRSGDQIVKFEDLAIIIQRALNA